MLVTGRVINRIWACYSIASYLQWPQGPCRVRCSHGMYQLQDRSQPRHQPPEVRCQGVLRRSCCCCAAVCGGRGDCAAKGSLQQG